MIIKEIKESIKDIVIKYPIKKISLIGSYANNTANNDSDIDLLVEFFSPNISLFTLYNIKSEIEDRLQKRVDLIHAPIEEDSLITIDKVIDIYEQ
ncbi:MAG: nucleotidyltransferase family protein [Caldicoprobacterales bacterium]|jgi:predicted nucleotidyltransferase|nr:nucleotidyltransferase domain-containing protein [Clostridiales bacterium]